MSVYYQQKGHGISESLMMEVRDVTRKFFQLPHEENLKIRTTPQSGPWKTFIYVNEPSYGLSSEDIREWEKCYQG
jgi:isopenicillin N synthase-like dioxygenase